MRRVLPLTIGSAALGLDAFIVAGILPLIGGNLHVSAAAVGQMVTVFTLSYAILAPICATFASGRPARAVLLLALAVFTVGNVLTAVTSALPLLLVARVIAGAGAGLYSPMSVAAAAAIVAPERRGRALAMVTGGMSSGVVLGVPIGLTLAHHLGWRSALWLVVGVTVVAVIGIVLFLPDVRAVAAPSLGARARILVDWRVVAVALVTITMATASIGSYTYLSQVLHRIAGTTNLTADLWAWGLGGLVGSFAVGQLIDRWRNTRALVTVIAAVLGVALLVLPSLGHQGLLTLVLLFVWGIAGWSSIAPQQHRMLALRPDDAAAAVSLNSSATYLGNAIGAGLGGALLGFGLSPVAVPVIFGAVVLVCGAANLLSPTGPARQPEPVAAAATVANGN